MPRSVSVREAWEVLKVILRREKRTIAPPGGLEPPTFRLTAERASRLRHGGGRWHEKFPASSVSAVVEKAEHVDSIFIHFAQKHSAKQFYCAYYAW